MSESIGTPETSAAPGTTPPEDSANRKVRRALFPVLDKRFQVRVTLFFLFLILLSHLFLLAIHYRNWRNTSFGYVGKAGVQLEQYKEQQQKVFQRDLILGIVVIGIMVGMVVFYLTTKVSGPLYNISRVLDDFAEGQYDRRAKLRKYDELQWFSDRLNKALDSLEKKLH